MHKKWDELYSPLTKQGGSNLFTFSDYCYPHSTEFVPGHSINIFNKYYDEISRIL